MIRDSRGDKDMRYFFEATDQLITIGSNFLVYSPQQVLKKYEKLSAGIEPHRVANNLRGNLTRLFSSYKIPLKRCIILILTITVMGVSDE